MNIPEIIVSKKRLQQVSEAGEEGELSLRNFYAKIYTKAIATFPSFSLFEYNL